MVKNFGIEETKLTDMEILQYVNSTCNIDDIGFYHEAVLDIIESYVGWTGDETLEYMDDFIDRCMIDIDF